MSLPSRSFYHFSPRLVFLVPFISYPWCWWWKEARRVYASSARPSPSTTVHTRPSSYSWIPSRFQLPGIDGGSFTSRKSLSGREDAEKVRARLRSRVSMRERKRERVRGKRARNREYTHVCGPYTRHPFNWRLPQAFNARIPRTLCEKEHFSIASRARTCL